MSYEGYREFLCERGHMSVSDAYDNDPKLCSFCGSPMAFRHSVDCTNGLIEDDPGTHPGPVKMVGFDDDWRTDHYGNKYATKVNIYDPIMPHWKIVEPQPNE